METNRVTEGHFQDEGFLSIYFDFVIHTKTLNNIYFIRNKSSHGGLLAGDDKVRLEDIFNNFDHDYSSYFQLLLNVVRGIKNV